LPCGVLRHSGAIGLHDVHPERVVVSHRAGKHGLGSRRSVPRWRSGLGFRASV